MIEFDAHPDCQLCSLFQSAKNPGLATRPLCNGQPVIKERAILFIGQSPGYQEDRVGKSFVGFTGQLLDKMVKASKLTEYVDVYLANACRCKPPQGANETQSEIRACREYLKDDVTKLQAQYKDVIVFALGAKACYSTLNISSLTETLKKQGKESKFFNGNPRVFATYHPAMLHPMRKPALIRAVETHFSLVLRYLKGEFLPNALTIVPEVGLDVPKVLPAEVSFDIETYGILAGVEQTVFHPVKSKEIDGIDYDNQVVTISFAWYDKGRLRTALYVWSNYSHRTKIRLWFKRLASAGGRVRPTTTG